MKFATIRDIAAEHAVTLTDEEVDAIVDDPRLREVISLVTYGHDLLRRIKGIATGPAVLSLWRGFAWTDAGSPNKEFRLNAHQIVHGESELSDVVLARDRNRGNTG